MTRNEDDHWSLMSTRLNRSRPPGRTSSMRTEIQVGLYLYDGTYRVCRVVNAKPYT